MRHPDEAVVKSDTAVCQVKPALKVYDGFAAERSLRQRLHDACRRRYCENSTLHKPRNVIGRRIQMLLMGKARSF